MKNLTLEELNNSYQQRGMKRRKTHNDYVEEVASKAPDMTVLGTYETNKKSILHKHDTCGHIWLLRPDKFINGKRCPKCAAERNILRCKEGNIGDGEYKERLLKTHSGSIISLESYVTISTHILHKHLECERTWYAAPAYTIFRKSGCPHCDREGGRYKKRSYNKNGKEFIIQGYEDRGINYLVDILKTPVEQIQTGKLKAIKYFYNNKFYNYYSDILIKSTKTLYEIKSTYTLGLKSDDILRRNQAKAIASREAGYIHKLLVVFVSGDDGVLLLPDNWVTMSLEDVVNLVGDKK